MFIYFKGIYSYPLRRTAIVFGSASLVFSFVYTTWVIMLQLNYFKNKTKSTESPESYVLYSDDDYHPIVYKSTVGLVFGSIQGYLTCLFSVFVIYGAIYRKRFFLLPYVIIQTFSIFLTICWMIAYAAANDIHKYDMMWFGIIFMQVQFTASIFRHFQELTEASAIPTAVDSRLPYGRMANAI